ncbi:MAG: hypothetical protein RBQ71_02725 [Acholeplasmataceae bacterium]|jgi:hypothetical protein|nr:hypothetical protein [Acholeplasmataceae bacterium]
MNDNEINYAFWTKVSLYFLLAVHLFILGYGIYSYFFLVNDSPGWGGMFVALFGYFFMVIGGFITILLLVLIFLHYRIKKSVTALSSFVKFTKIFQIITMIVILLITSIWLVAGMSNQDGLMIMLSILTLLPSIFVLINTSKFPYIKKDINV